MTDEIAATKGSGVTSAGKLQATDTFAQSNYDRWTTHQFNDQSQLTKSRVYHTIPSSGLGSSGTNYVETTFEYDAMDRLDREESPGGTITQRQYDDRGMVSFIWHYYDNLDRIIKTDRHDTSDQGDLIAREETKYDLRGRVFQQIRYEVNPSTGAVGDKLVDDFWYDCCGNLIKRHRGGTEEFTKMTYDGVARNTKLYVGFDVDESTYAHAESITGDSIFEQITFDYNDAGNLIQRATLRRYHDNSSTGALVAGTSARPEHVALWHDAKGRTVATAAYGNQANDSASFSRPTTIPSASDNVLVSKVEFNAAGDAFKFTDPSGKEDRVEFDDRGRPTKRIQNYADGNPTTGVQQNTFVR